MPKDFSDVSDFEVVDTDFSGFSDFEVVETE